MKRLFEKFSPSTLAVFLIILVGCGGAAAKSGLDRIDQIMNESSTVNKVFVPPLPDSPDFNNYNAAQRLYASKTSIIWCTTTWGNPSAPMVTIPIQSKLTSSSVSFFPSSRIHENGHDDGSHEYTPERRSVDGMYHGTPPPYRYGFTPGGQYVDFFNMPTLCTTALTKFQRAETKLAISTDDVAAQADSQAQQALAHGDHAGAQRILEDALGGK